MHTSRTLNYKCDPTDHEEQANRPPTDKTNLWKKEKTFEAMMYHKKRTNAEDVIPIIPPQTTRPYHEIVAAGRAIVTPEPMKRNPLEQGLPKKPCFGCGSDIEVSKAFIIDKEGKSYHSECFRCNLCREVIRDAQYKPGEFGPVCLQCGLPQCAACLNLIVGDLIVANHVDGTPYSFHTQCLKCVDCSCHIYDKYKATDQGFKCNLCGNPSCIRCRQVIPGGTQYYLNSGAPECGNCYMNQQQASNTNNNNNMFFAENAAKNHVNIGNIGGRLNGFNIMPRTQPLPISTGNMNLNPPTLAGSLMQPGSLMPPTLAGSLMTPIAPHHSMIGATRNSGCFIMGPPPAYAGGPQLIYR